MKMCAIAPTIVPARAGAAPATGPAHAQTAALESGCCRGSGPGTRWRAAPSRQQRSRAPREEFAASREACAATPLWLRFDSVSARSPAYRDKLQAKSGTAGGRVCPIARRFASTVCLVVYKDRQFEVNYMQSAAKQQLPEKSRFTENCQASAA